MLCLPRNPWAGVRYLRRNGIPSGDRKEQEEKGARLTKKGTKEQKEKAVQKR